MPSYTEFESFYKNAGLVLVMRRVLIGEGHLLRNIERFAHQPEARARDDRESGSVPRLRFGLVCLLGRTNYSDAFARWMIMNTPRVINLISVSLVFLGLGALAIGSSEEPPTEVYVETDPPGAVVIVDGKEVGTSPGLFEVEPGTREIVVKSADHDSTKEEVDARGSRITKIRLQLDGKPKDVAPGGLSRQQWIVRLKGLKGHMAAAFGLGPELAHLEPEFGSKLVAEVWPDLTDHEVKQGLLKAFHFQKNPHVLRVLHLGVTDAKDEVREYALAYVFDYSKQKFHGDTDEYRAWYAKNRDRPLDEVKQDSLLDARPAIEKKLQEILVRFTAGDLKDVQNLASPLLDCEDPVIIPTLIGVIDADNSYDTVYGVGYFALRRVTGVDYRFYHDGPWWRRWWEKNKAKYPEDVRNWPIPALPKTAHALGYTPFPENLDTLDGQLEWLVKCLEDDEQRSRLSDIAGTLAELEDPRAIPTMIGVIDADNSYDTVYGVGYFGLGRLTKVSYTSFHDGAWWRRWWEKNKSKYPEKVRDLPIPDLPKTAHGGDYTPFPESMDTLKGQLDGLVKAVASGKTGGDIWFTAQEIAKAKDPSVIPTMIGLIEAEKTERTIYGIGYYGLGKLTGVRYAESHDGEWWRQWWEENKSRYEKDVQEIEIPDYSEAAAGWGKILRAAERKDALADVADVPAEDLTVEGNERMRYFLIGAGEGAKPPEGGYRLVVVMPGGDGGEDFHPFVRRLWKNSLGKEFLVAQPVAFKWEPSQRITWPTSVNPNAAGQEFSTEEFVEAVIKDVKGRHSIDQRCVFTLSWSSGGPAGYAVSLQEETAVKGSYVAMSVFRHEWLPGLDAAGGHFYWLDHSPEDKVCPFSHAKQAEKDLGEAGATVRMTTYSGGHGWRGDVYGRVRSGIGWLVGSVGGAP